MPQARQSGPTDGVHSCDAAELSADAAGDRDEALVYARQALADREPPFILLARHWPDFAGLRQDPRFAALLKQLEDE